VTPCRSLRSAAVPLIKGDTANYSAKMEELASVPLDKLIVSHNFFAGHRGT